MSLAFRLASPLLARLDPEQAHRIAIRALQGGLVPRPAPADDPRLRVTLAGLGLPGPVGLAAGFDKDGEVVDAMLGQGFAFVEVGSVTPLPQEGNRRPRLFRLAASRAVINRMGFNNAGHEALRERLAERAQTLATRAGRVAGVVGINLGANKDSADFVADYEDGLIALGGLADYFTVNVSSPNTPGLRALQAGEAMAGLLARVLARRDAAAPGRPLFLKLSPDLDDAQLGDVADALAARPPDGVIVSNTTLARPGLERLPAAAEAGGLSGRPLFRRSTVMLARLARAVRERGLALPLIGVGGVEDGATALAKIEAGASAVQVYSAMVWRGPGLAPAIHAELSALLARRGVPGLSVLVGTRMEEWAARSPD